MVHPWCSSAPAHSMGGLVVLHTISYTLYINLQYIAMDGAWCSTLYMLKMGAISYKWVVVLQHTLMYGW
jgi:hypothetical protein